MNDGGLGIRCANTLATSAFLASAASTISLQQYILPSSYNQVPYQDRVSIEMIWSSLSSANTPDQQLQRFHKELDSPMVKTLSQAIDTSAKADVDRARLKAACAPHSGDWLQTPPIASVGLLLSDEEIRFAVAYRLGTRACSPYTCACGKAVDARGLHGLSCRRSIPRHQHHSMINDIIWRAIKRA